MNDLFNKIFFLFAVIVLITACSGAKRFTSEDDHVKEKPVTKTSTLKEMGVASYYADEFHGRQTASGETYNMYELTAAHPTLPFNTIVKVKNLANDKTVTVRINDHFPSTKNRIIDLSLEAAKQIDMIRTGTTLVTLEIIKQGDVEN